MASPTYDEIGLHFRRMYGDMYVKDTETQITAVTQDGQDFSAVELKKLAIHSINQLLTVVAQQAQIGAIALSSVVAWFSEYADEDSVSLTVSGNIGTGTLPASYFQPLSANLVRASGNPRRIREVDEKEFNYVATGRNPEHNYSPVFRIVGTQIKVAYVDPTVAFSNADSVLFQYLKFQGDFTQGSTDVDIKAVWTPKVVEVMLSQARSFVNS